MEHPKIIDLVEYRTTQQTSTSQVDSVCSEDLAIAIRELIQRLRDRNPIEQATG